MRTILFFLCILLAGCKPDSKPGSLSVFFEELQHEAKANPLPIESNDIMSPVFLECYDDLLICANSHGDKRLRIYDLNTGEILNELLMVGRANNEIMRVSTMHLLNDTLNVYCSNSNKLFSIPVDQLYSPDPVFDVQVDFGGFLRALPLKNDLFATIGKDENGHIQLVDKAGKIVQMLEGFPNDDVSDLVQEKSLAYQGALCSNPTGAKFAYGSTFGMMLRFWLLGNNMANEQKEYVLTKPDYVPSSAGQSFSIQWKDESPRGVLDMAGSDEYCFVLYEDNKHVMDQNWALSSVYVFTWEGVPVQKIILDRPVDLITYHKASQKLIALTQTEKGEPEFVSFKIRI